MTAGGKNVYVDPNREIATVDIPNPHHPTPETLRAYGAGKLDDASADAVHRHLEICEECQLQVAEMWPDSFLGRLREAHERPEHSAIGPSGPRLSPTGSTVDDDAIVDSSVFPRMSSTGQVDATSDRLINRVEPSLHSGTLVGYFGDYELEKVLGEGGMGIVYKARQLSLNRPVALKMIKAARFASTDEVRRFQNESEAVARLDHPNIVPVFEVGQYEDQHYFSMKLIAGASLDKRATDYIADPRRAAELLATAAAAIHHAHQRGILHRDLTPANILIDSEGRPHVTDFGLAKRVEGDSELTRSGAIVGTPAYMAPEQASGKRGAVTTATDVYGLGAVLYVLLTGKAPFGGGSVIDTLEQVRERRPEAPTKRNRRVPRDLELICLKSLEKDPRRRYTSADALAEDLKRWLGGHPIAARRVGNAVRLWMFCRRNPIVTGAAGLVAVAMAVVVVLSTLYTNEQKRHARDQGNATTRISVLHENLEKNREILENSHADSDRRLSVVFFERAQRAFDGGQVNRGMLWLVESLRAAINSRDPFLQNLDRANLSYWRYHCAELRGVFPHYARGARAALSPDGKTLLTKSGDRCAQLLNVASGRAVGASMVHDAYLNSMAFSPDGKTIVTGSADKTARLWDAFTGRPVGQPLQHQGSVNSVACSPNGATVLTGSTDRLARLWNARTAEQIAMPMAHRGSVMSVAFSPDGETLLTSSADGRAHVWDTAGRPVGKPMEHASRQMRSPAVNYSPGGKFMEQPAPEMQSSVVSYSPDGTAILTASYDEARLWNAATAEPLCEPLSHKSIVICAAFSPNGKAVITGCEDKTARLWSTQTGMPIGEPLKHQGEVSAVAFSPDGKSVLTGSTDSIARQWDAATAQTIGRPMIHQGRVVFAIYSPHGRTVLTGADDDTARLWDADTAQPTGQALEHSGSVKYVAFSPNGELFLTLGSRTDRTVRLWATTSGVPFGQPIDDPDTVSAAAFSRDSRMVVTVSYRNVGRFWDVATTKPIGRPLHLWDGVNGKPAGSVSLQYQVRSVTFSPDDKTFLTQSLDGAARLWKVTTGQQIMHQVDATSAAFSPDGKSVVTGSSGRRVGFWDTSSGYSRGLVLEHSKGPVWPLTFSPDGLMIITAGGDNTARLWDATTGKPVGEPLLHQSVVTDATFFSEHNIILTRTAEITSLWRASTGEPIGQPLVPPDGESVEAINPRTKTILTRSAGGRLRLWDAATAQPIGPPLDHGGSIDSVAYSSDGGTIVAATSNAKNKVRVWHLPTILDYDLARMKVWVETITGLSADDQGIIRPLDSESWLARSERLHRMGGPPQPDPAWMFLPSKPLRTGAAHGLRNPYEPDSTGGQ